MNFTSPMTTEETKAVEFDILSKFDDFCKAHSLSYFLAYGTLIGAVRHGGFIPWDDDIDIQMPREDYNRLLELFPKLSPFSNLRLIAPTDPDAEHTFIKITDERTVKVEAGHLYKSDSDYRGIDIDIFPLDGQPKSDKEYVKWYKRLRSVYRKIWISELEAEGDIKFSLRLAIAVFKIVRIFLPKRKKLLAKAAALHAMYPYSESEYVGCVESYFNGIGNRNPKSAYEVGVTLPFEGRDFPVPSGYDQILTNMYGDYMKLPPGEAQVTHHTNKTYWREGQNEKI